MKAATQNITSAFVTGGPTLATSATPGRWAGQFGAGLLYRVDERLSVDLNYDLYLKSKYYNNVAYLNFNYLF